MINHKNTKKNWGTHKIIKKEIETKRTTYTRTQKQCKHYETRPQLRYHAKTGEGCQTFSHAPPCGRAHTSVLLAFLLRRLSVSVFVFVTTSYPFPVYPPFRCKLCARSLRPKVTFCTLTKRKKKPTQPHSLGGGGWGPALGGPARSSASGRAEPGLWPGRTPPPMGVTS